MAENPLIANYQESVLDTQEVEVPPRPAQAHEGEIVGVEIFESENTGTVAIQINLQSLNTGDEDRFLLFVPELFVENIGVDASELPSEEGNNQLFSYRRGISNKDKDATLQRLRQIALSQGRGAVLEGQPKPTDFESFVGQHNNLLSGTRVIYRKRETKREDGQKFYGVTQQFDAPEDKDNPKKFKKYQKMWEAGN